MRSTMYPNDHGSTAPRIAGVGAAVAMASYAVPALSSSWPAGFPRSPAPIWPALRRSLGVEDCTASRRGWALTFDDGPHAQGTPAVLEALASSGVSATFFLVGEQVLRNPSLPGEIIAAGHAIGLHCHRHRNLLRLPPWQVHDDLKRARAVIEDASGVSPALYRPHYGELKARAVRVGQGG